VLAGRFQVAQEIIPGVVEATEDRLLVCAFVERLHGYALVQARRAEEAGARFERSLELARGQGADYEVALTLEAQARPSGARRPKAGRFSTAAASSRHHSCRSLDAVDCGRLVL
jgi:hypothetical protein